MNYQKLINNGIKRLREKLNLTQEQFAEKVGLSVHGLSNIERNKYQPNSDTIDMICQNFGVHPIDLLLEYPEKLESKDAIHQINAILKTLSPEELNKLLKVLNALKD